MKRTLLTSLVLLACISAGAQGILDRYSEPGVPKTVFIPKGSKAIGISGGYRSIKVGGENVLEGDGYAFLSMLNIGNGSFSKYNISPKFSFFISDDIAFGFSLDYSGFELETDLKMDLRNYGFLDELFGGVGNYKIASRKLKKDSWGISMKMAKYQSFFGSRTFGVFAEARLYGEISKFTSCPIEDLKTEEVRLDDYGEPYTVQVLTGETRYKTEQQRTSNAYGAGIRLAGGVAVKLRDNSSLTISIPLIGLTYGYTKQHKEDTNNKAYISQFNISRDFDFIAIQVGYTRYFTAK